MVVSLFVKPPQPLVDADVDPRIDLVVFDLQQVGVLFHQCERSGVRNLEPGGERRPLGRSVAVCRLDIVLRAAAETCGRRLTAVAEDPFEIDGSGVRGLDDAFQLRSLATDRGVLLC